MTQHRGENKRKTKQEKDQWRTPPEIFGPLNEAFKFDLDVAADAENALLPNFYTEKDNGLEMDWATWTFVNPPFSAGQHVEWIDKAIKERGKGNNSVLLCINGIGNLNFETALEEAHYILFPYRRINYLDDDGKAHSVNLYSLILIFSQYELYARQVHILRKIGRLVPVLELKRRGLW